jgi:hypothetical protein
VYTHNAHRVCVNIDYSAVRSRIHSDTRSSSQHIASIQELASAMCSAMCSSCIAKSLRGNNAHVRTLVVPS